MMPFANLNDDFGRRFNAERARLLQALGEVTEAGVVENIQHIGATSIPGLPARPCMDIALAVWSCPLPPTRQQALEEAGCQLPHSRGVWLADSFTAIG